MEKKVVSGKLKCECDASYETYINIGEIELLELLWKYDGLEVTITVEPKE